MNMPGLIAIVIGIVSICAYVADRLAKRKARGETPVQAQVTQSQDSVAHSHSSSHSRSTSYIVKTVFNVPPAGPLSHSKTFGTKIDANAWATRFGVGSFHAVVRHPYAPDEVLLQEELQKSSPAALAVGVMALLIGALVLYFA